MIKRSIVKEDGTFYPWWDNLVSYINDTYRPNRSFMFMDYRDELLAEYKGRYYVVGTVGDYKRFVEFPDERYWILFLVRWS